MNRRNFLKKSPLIPISLSLYELSKKESKIDKDEIHLEDIILNDTPIKLFGVYHTAQTIENYSKVERLVGGSSKVILEFNSVHSKYNAKNNQYFKSVIDLCSKHNKDIIYLNPYSKLASDIDLVVGFSSLICLGYIGFDTLISEKITKRKFMQNSIMSFFSSVLFINTYIGSNLLKNIEEYLGISDQKLKNLFVNYINDYRNVVMTKKLKQYTKKETNKNEYILLNFGINHTRGIKFYLDNPVYLEKKINFYNHTFDFIKTEKPFSYKYISDNWIKEIINLD
jgi:hypothetical protein